jgi:hypothetical protein
MMRKFRTALGLSGRDWVLLAQAWGLFLLVDLALRLLPFTKVRDAAARVRGRGPADRSEMERVQRIVGMAAGNHIYPMPCLRRALVVQWLLGRRGVETDLRFGVRRGKDALSAHAWLEREGAPLGETGDPEERFAVLSPIPAPSIQFLASSIQLPATRTQHDPF